MIPRTAFALLTLSALAFAACGSDDDTASGSAPTADELEGTTFESTDVTGHELVADTTISLAFQDDRVSANGGCNTMNGGYTITDGTLEVAAMASTMMACSDELMAQDDWLAEFLAGGPEIALDGDTLTLTGGDSTMTLEAVQDADVEGTTWMITGTVATEAVSSIPEGAEPSLTITDGQAAIVTGCNNGSGSVEVTDTTMTFGPIATTKMACEPDLTALETSILTVLQGEVTYEIDGATMSIRRDGPDGEVGLELTAG
jgi:heat shock protein HslJ